jgi:hypothetical protein
LNHSKREKAAYKIQLKRNNLHCLFLAFCDCHALCGLSKAQTTLSLINTNQNGYHANNRLCTMLHSGFLALL